MDIQCNYMKQVNYWDLLTDGVPKAFKIEANLAGQRYGYNTVVSSLVFKKVGNKERKYFCFASCSCASPVKVHRYGDMISNRIMSCGCQVGKASTNIKHGLSGTPVYYKWKSMKSRCYRKEDPGYHNYGGRGIVMCDEWKDSPKSFCEWAESNGYQEGLEVDRIDPDGNYEPSNIRFVTRKQNALNRRGRKNTSSRYKGVVWCKQKNKWHAIIGSNKKNVHIGYFVDEQDAAIAYNNKAIELGGEYAWLNKFDED